MTMQRIERIEGRAVPVHGANIDTDRIIPARFLVAVSFEGLEAHVFADDRAAAGRTSTPHPFDVPAYQGASILLVNSNFGCGSSREHAPQALMRRGIRAIVGESFSEIFSGNSLAMGLPCFTASAADLERLMARAEEAPLDPMVVSVSNLTVTAGSLVVNLHMPAGIRDSFLTGLWDATGLLLDEFEQVRAVARRLPYTGSEKDWRSA
jgi:3-isopropylmalate/(R)-2-methylmalate dehydratase small subunit